MSTVIGMKSGATFSLDSRAIGKGVEGKVFWARDGMCVKILNKPPGAGEAEKVAALAALSNKVPGFSWPIEAVVEPGTDIVRGHVMHFVAGDNLQEILDQRGTAALSVVGKATLALKITEAVAVVHALSGPTIVLGDVLKAGNLIIDIANKKATFVDVGPASVSMFGYRRLDGGVGNNESRLSTPGSVPPEVLANPTAKPSHVADRFALPVLLFELLFGRPPYEPKPCVAAVRLDAHEAVRQGIFPRYTRHRDFEAPTYDPIDVPKEIEELFYSAFLSVTDRPTAARWHEAFERWLEVLTPPVPAAEQTPPPATPSWQRADRLAIAAVVITLSLVIGRYAITRPARVPASERPLPSKRVGPPIFQEIFK